MCTVVRADLNYIFGFDNVYVLSAEIKERRVSLPIFRTGTRINKNNDDASSGSESRENKCFHENDIGKRDKNVGKSHEHTISTGTRVRNVRAAHSVVVETKFVNGF